MALNTSIESPNLKVYQISRSSQPTFSSPSLGALIVGPCKEIVNAFDNALLYTDHVLASLIGKLHRDGAALANAMAFTRSLLAP